MRRIALVGNPNVGKSTIFNALTGMHQKTGNWAGVTVSFAAGMFELFSPGSDAPINFSIVDLPGIYSFDVRSEEETVTRDYVRDETYDFLLLVCDATCLERGLHLLKQVGLLLAGRKAAASDSPVPNLILSVNLCDEARKKGIVIDFPALEQTLGIPVIPCSARESDGLDRLKHFLSTVAFDDPVLYQQSLHFDPPSVAEHVVNYTNTNYRAREERLDRVLTGPVTGTLCMLLLLTGVFWLTVTGANYPSSLLWDFFFRIEPLLANAMAAIHLPAALIDALVYGIYRVVAWIVSVMLPPMAIFFPLFTLLEDFGYLPRMAFNMDGAFERCGACGKQCLTMAMGLGCNAAGVTGCRIIDSPRERLIAILTNSLVPCNGRFPLLITMISLGVMAFAGDNTVFHSGSARPFLQNLIAALALTGFILLGVLATLAVSRLLSRTLLKGVSSSFTLELPPYRRPQVKKVLVRSIFDRTLFVLGRAVLVAAPAGLLIWVMANLTITNSGLHFGHPVGASDAKTLLTWCAGFLEPLGNLMGLDGIILMAFILGFPANEIVLPIILMAYLQTGHLTDMEDTGVLFGLLHAHGWTMKTYLCMAVFSLFHWPCSTTCLTIKKETASLKWTAVAFLIPTSIGIVGCMIINLLCTGFV